MVENIVNDAVHDILESDEFDKLLDDQNQAKAGLYEPSITNQANPSREDELLEQDLEEAKQARSSTDDLDKVYDKN